MKQQMGNAWKTAIVEHLIAVNHKPRFQYQAAPLSRGEKLSFFATFSAAALLYWAVK